MPHRRKNRTRFRRRRRTFRRRPRARRRQPRRLMLDPERKFFQLASPNAAIPDVGSASMLNPSLQGTGPTDRIGLQHLTISSLVNYTATINLVSQFPTVLKVALILWKQPAGQTINLADVWTQNGTGLAPLGPRTLDHALEYRVLWSRIHRLTSDKQSVTASVFRNHRIKTRFLGAGGAIADTNSGALYFIAISTTAMLAEMPTVEFMSRVRFVG